MEIPIAQVAAAAAAVTPKEPPKVDVDESKPTATVQIRLADGTKLQAKFNTGHRVADIRDFIVRYFKTFFYNPHSNSLKLGFEPKNFSLQMKTMIKS